jgi:hypothetical protein
MEFKISDSNLTIDPKRICYVCGFNFDTEKISQKQFGAFILCPCCLFEYGVDDLETDCFIYKRDQWIEEGLPFGNNLNSEVYEWSLNNVLTQLKNLVFVNISNYINGEKMNPNYTNEIDIEKIKSHWHLKRNIT